MPYIPGGYAHIAHPMFLENDPEAMYCTYGVKIGSVDQAVINDLDAAFKDSLKPIISSAYTLGAAILTTLTVQVISALTDEAGEDNPACLPSNCAGLFKKNTGFIGRANRGRIYLPGVSEGNVDPTGRLTDSQWGVMTSSAEDWLGAVQAATDVDDMVVLHGTEGLGAPSPVTSLTVDRYIATQRRRMRP